MTPMGRRDIQVSYVQDNFFAIGSCDPPFANVTLQLKKDSKIRKLMLEFKKSSKSEKGIYKIHF